MPKAYFWPVALIVMGIVLLASRLEMIPADYADLWPVLLLVVGLGGLLTADRTEWLYTPKKSSTTTKAKTKKKK
ncbi:MAG TPA: DUF5668 domain-containing protein [Candidatus Woesebacteria bacterium]|nr:DUF5668 domain-containing protein [Candidatus Woesebacteria bacterium]